MRTDENVVARVHGNTPYKVIFISENLKSFAWALKSRIQLKESGIHLPMISNPESGEYLESGIYTMGSRIQDCLGFLYMELMEVTLSVLWTPGDMIMISYR